VTRISRFVLHHRLAVLLVWVVLAGAGFATLSTTAGRLSSNFSIPHSSAYKINARLVSQYGNGGSVTPTVVAIETPPGMSAASPAAEAVTARAFAAAQGAAPGSRLADFATTADPKFASGREAIALVFTAMGKGPFGAQLPTAQMQAAAGATLPAGWTVGATGLSQLEQGTSSKGTSTLAETMLGGLGALVVLAFVFASLLAFLPLIMAVVTIPTTFLIIGGMTHVTSVSFIVEFLVALIGLGVAIDYSLLVLTRWREQRAKGMANDEAVTLAMASAGRAVVVSGLTVGLSLLALLVLPVPFLQNVALAGFLIPLVSVAAAVTLLPVVLSKIGPRMDWPRIRNEGQASRPWTAWASFVVRHRLVGGTVGTLLLLALILPLAHLRLGEPSTSALAPKGPAHQTLTTMVGSGIPSGVITPIEVLATSQAAPAVARDLVGVPGVYTATFPQAPGWTRHGTAVVEVLASAEPSTAAGSATVSRVRAAAGALPGVIGVGGAGPAQADFIHEVYGSFPLMLALISVATFLLLARAFRSMVLAAKAVVFNLLSVGASFGVMILVWQSGHGSNLLWSTPATGSVTVWVPIMVFAFLFGLSMDYEVFILSRTREAYDESRSTMGAAITGVGRTGRLVTSAAAILFLSFLSMSTAPDTDVKVMATGLGAGILLDALLVRSLLVPAYVGLLGRWNWWLPSALARVLRTAPSRLPVAAEPAV
jgi:RND superfamily putative drug exporter